MSPERKHFAHQTVGVATKMGLLSEKGVGVWKTKNSMPVLQELWDAGHSHIPLRDAKLMRMPPCAW